MKGKKRLLTGKQKRYLRALAHPLKPIFQVGKAGVNANLIQQVNDALEARELIKVSVLSNCPQSGDEVGVEISEKCTAEWVQSIGHTLVFYKPSQENPRIKLPR